MPPLKAPICELSAWKAKEAAATTRLRTLALLLPLNDLADLRIVPSLLLYSCIEYILHESTLQAGEAVSEREQQSLPDNGSSEPHAQDSARRAARATLVPLARFVLIPLAAQATGYTERAIHKKIDDGIWRRGHEWRKAPDGRRLIDLQAVEAWITSCR